MTLETILEGAELIIPAAEAATDWMTSRQLNQLASPSGLPKTEAIHHYIKSVGGTVITEAEHPTFIKHVYDLANELKLSYKPIVAFAEKIPFGISWLQHLPNAVALDVGLVFCTNSLMNLSKSTPAYTPSPALKSIIAHEFSHLKYDVGMGSKLVRKSPILLPAAAMLGLMMYDKAIAKSQGNENVLAQVKQNIHRIADGEQARIDEEQRSQDAWRMEPEVHRPLIEVGRYLAVGAIGLVAAYLLQRHSSLAKEYRADKVAVELAKAPEAYKQILIDIDKAQKEMVHQIVGDPKALKSMKANPVKFYLEVGKGLIREYFTFAHPSLPERLAYVDRVSANMAARAAPLPWLA